MPGVGRGGLQHSPHRPRGLSRYRSALNFLLSILVFSVFQIFIFGRLVKKHSARIGAYLEERHFFWKFFDGKSFAIMAVMMTGGIGLRSSGLAPERFIAVFYTAWAPRAAGRAAVRPQLRQSAPSAAELQNKTEHEGE